MITPKSSLIIKTHTALSPFLGTIKFAHAQNQFDRSRITQGLAQSKPYHTPTQGKGDYAI
jgi:hypothetical protein